MNLKKEECNMLDTLWLFWARIYLCFIYLAIAVVWAYVVVYLARNAIEAVLAMREYNRREKMEEILTLGLLVAVELIIAPIIPLAIWSISVSQYGWRGMFP